MKVLAYYAFVPIENPEAEVKAHKAFFATRAMRCRIYISHEGINGQVSASEEAAKEYIEWMHSRSPFEEVHFKVHVWDSHVFPRQQIKYREQLVAFDASPPLEERGAHASPAEWKEMLEGDEEYLKLDVRNDYEWDVGHFEGFERPPCSTSRDFIPFAEKLAQTHDPKKTKVMMCCTGGIRCEIYSALLKTKGFETVYQLNGGIINYGLEEGNAHWEGELFVFDDRMVVPISDEAPTQVSHCKFCETPTTALYNCANMDCNTLFTACEKCLKTNEGCCQSTCQNTPKTRPLDQQNPHRPFRKWYNYFSAKA